jgi:hypothetical protein
MGAGATVLHARHDLDIIMLGFYSCPFILFAEINTQCTIWNVDVFLFVVCAGRILFCFVLVIYSALFVVSRFICDPLRGSSIRCIKICM